MGERTFQAGTVLEELLGAGVLTVDDVADAVGVELGEDGSVSVDGDVVTVDPG